jgi:nucleoside phosphorylase
MKILVADDNNDKIARIIAASIENSTVSRDDIHVAHTVADARRELQSHAFDLLVLDILLPAKAGDTPSHTATLSLLEEITSRDTLKKPGHIVGLTAYDDALREAGPDFVKRTWTVIHFSPESFAWSEQLRACVDYIAARLVQPAPPQYGIDLCVITALPTPEFAAVERLPWNLRAAEPLDDNTFVRRGTFTSHGSTFQVTAATATKVGVVSTALLTAKLVQRERPRFVVMVGICAGIKGKTNVGDVIFGDPIWDWQSGKHIVGPEGQRFAIAPDPQPLASFVRARANQARQDSTIWNGIRDGWPTPPQTSLRAHIGPMATGASVVADQDIVDSVVAQNRNALAIDMESFGAVCACISASHPRPTGLSIKAVCDFADDQKSDDWQAYAAYTSAEAMRSFFEHHMHQIRGLAGTR